jgi:hypothetical protein
METVYIGHSGTIDLQLMSDGAILAPEQMSAITDVGIIVFGTNYRASVYPDAFDFVTRADEGVVSLMLGDVLATQGTDLSAYLIIYSSDWPDGIVWGSIVLQVKAV